MNIQERIEMMEKELAKLKEEASVLPWNPIGGDFLINSYGYGHSSGTEWESRDFGTERHAEKLAERAWLMMRRFNRLLAYHDEFCPEHDPTGDWGSDVANLTVCLNSDSSDWQTAKLLFSDYVTVYFPEDVAIELCRKLNAGEVVL